MDLSYSADYEAFRGEVRAFLDTQWSAGDRAAHGASDALIGRIARPDARVTAFRKRAIEAGYLYRNIPREWGGGEQAFDPLKSAIIREEFKRAKAPREMVGQGPSMLVFTLLEHGTEQQKRFFIRSTLLGELLWCQGYSEPGAGSDLASLRTRAELDGDEWVINGQKVFTTHAGDADYVWLAARTDTEAPKHKGISIILVPTSAAGFSCTPLRTIGGELTYVTYYDHIRVPVTNTVGPVNGGWSLITGQLNLERIVLAMPASLDRVLEEVWAWAQTTERPGGGPVIDEPWVQESLARVYAQLDALKVLNWHAAWLMDQGSAGMAEASAVKVFGTETVIACYRDLLEITRQQGIVRHGQPGALVDGLLESAYRLAMVNTFGGGVNEVQRDIIAMAGLGLPRARR